jgi:pyruvate-ferredoxin/flavodoxin oxidoreductase
MSEGGSLVWESEETGEQAWERLPLWARKQIIDKKIRVFTLPGFEIARNATDPRRPAAPHAGQRVPRRVLRRVADAPGVRHHAEQFRDAVHKQYVKKFGKLGDASCSPTWKS